MRALALAVLLAAPAGAQYWAKTYAPPPFKETWTGQLTVRDLYKDVREVVKAVEKNGGKLTAPLENLVGSTDSHQLSFTVPSGKVKAAVERLRKLGKLDEPIVTPYFPPFPRDEVKSKLRALEGERKASAAEFSRLPISAQIVDELTAHLREAEKGALEAEGRVRLNITVKRAP